MSEIDDILRAAQAPDTSAERPSYEPYDSAPIAMTDDEIEAPPSQATPRRGTTANANAADKGDAADKGEAVVASEPRPKADKYLIAFYIVLCLISIVELYSASSREVTSGNIFGPLIRHLSMLVIGIVACIAVSRVKIKYFGIFTPTVVVISVLMMVYVLLNGQIVNGARRSFSLMGIPLYPAEFLKFSAVLIVAYIMARNQEKHGVRTRGVVWCTAWITLFCALLFSQGLTNTLLLMAISLSMMLIGGVQIYKFLLVCAFYIFLGGGAMYVKMHQGTSDTTMIETGVDASGNRATVDRSATWKKRISRHSSDKPLYTEPITAENRQEMYSYMAQANGGVTGVKPGNSRETARLPLAFSDYIYAIVVEDWGFAGGSFLLIIYLSLLGRAFFIAARCDRALSAFLVIGMAVMICFQALFHMAIVTGVFPVSGQPLPMISKGGTSMIVTSVAFGIMLSVSRYTAKKGKRKAKKLPPVEMPQDINAVNPIQL